MGRHPPFRRARKEDARIIAELFRVASEGVSDYVWSTLADEYPGLSLIEIGERRYARENTEFSYQNCVVVEFDGRVEGMLLTFPIPAQDTSDEATGNGVPEEDREPEVLSPYGELEVPGSWYVCAVALSPEYRGQGLGSQLLELAEKQAREGGCSVLSLLVFEENAGAAALYRRLAFQEVDRRPVVPHPFIRHGGNVLLMTKNVEPAP